MHGIRNSGWIRQHRRKRDGVRHKLWTSSSCIRCWCLRVVGEHLFEYGNTAIGSACSLCLTNVLSLSPNFDSAPEAQATREHRWRHIKYLLFECLGVLGLGKSIAIALLQDDTFGANAGSAPAEALLPPTFPYARIPVITATACLVPFLPDPAATFGRHPLVT